MADFLLAGANRSPLAAAIRTAIGVGPDEDVQVTTPVFDRPSAWDPAMLPPNASDRKAWSGFSAADRETLRGWGCRPWSLFTTERPSEPNRCSHVAARYFDADPEEHAGTTPTHELWLFPAEWYDAIPDGFPITDINGCLEVFERGKTDDDRRYGMLAFGVMIPYVALLASSVSRDKEKQ